MADFPETAVGAKALFGSATYHKVHLTYRSLWVGYYRAKLVRSNFGDESTVAEYSARVSDLVSAFEDASKLDGFLDRLQDATAVLLFDLGRFLVQ